LPPAEASSSTAEKPDSAWLDCREPVLKDVIEQNLRRGVEFRG
jgi:hypothetical protein